MSLLRKGEKIRDRPRPTGKGPLIGALLLAASLFACVYFYLDWARSGQKERIAGLEALSARLTVETVPMRFMVVSRDEAGLRARIKLYDLAGKELVLVEKALPGKELYLDFLLSPLPGESGSEARWLAFPYRIFTDELPAAQGVLLLDSYEVSGFPSIYDGQAPGDKPLGPGERKALAAVFARARRSGGASGKADTAAPVDYAAPRHEADFGSAVHDVSALSRFEVGVVYKVVCRAKGGIEVMED
jgi:hypothetical protein